MRRFWTYFSVIMVLVFLVTGFLLLLEFPNAFGPLSAIVPRPAAAVNTPTVGPPPPTPTAGPPGTPTVGPAATPTPTSGGGARPSIVSNPFGLPTPVVAGLFVLSAVSTLVNTGRGLWFVAGWIGRKFRR